MGQVKSKATPSEGETHSTSPLSAGPGPAVHASGADLYSSNPLRTPRPSQTRPGCSPIRSRAKFCEWRPARTGPNGSTPRSVAPPSVASGRLISCKTLFVFRYSTQKLNNAATKRGSVVERHLETEKRSSSRPCLHLRSMNFSSSAHLVYLL